MSALAAPKEVRHCHFKHSGVLALIDARAFDEAGRIIPNYGLVRVGVFPRATRKIEYRWMLIDGNGEVLS